MKTVAGVFKSHRDAARAAGDLAGAGFSRGQINLFFPESAEVKVHSIPTSDTEQPGVAGAIGGAVGAALGLAGGFELMGATALIPGVGPVVAVGIAGAALFGLAGAAVGSAVGTAVDEGATEGVPSDELFFYEDALRQGRSLVIVLADGDHEARRARDIIAHHGAESLDAARHAWWIGLRDVEAEHYRALGHNFEHDQEVYRAGFEAALRKECRGQDVDSTSDCLKWWYPDVWDTEPFRGATRAAVSIGAKSRGRGICVAGCQPADRLCDRSRQAKLALRSPYSRRAP